ncbi:MAG: hypothetical protein IPP82_06875 [Xanthomonadales bacterium]|nr:hypothetical protein [Xanthomonadales bacterium]
MITNEFNAPDTDRSTPSAAPAPALGDVIDAVDDAAATFKAVVRNEADSLLHDFRSLIREQPITSIAVAGALAYLIGRVGR